MQDGCRGDGIRGSFRLSCLCAPLLFRRRCFRVPRRSRKLRSRGRRQQRVSRRATHRRSRTALAGCLSSVPLRVTVRVRSHVSALLYGEPSLLRFRLTPFLIAPFVVASPCLPVSLSVCLPLCVRVSFPGASFHFRALEGSKGRSGSYRRPYRYCQSIAEHGRGVDSVPAPLRGTAGADKAPSTLHSCCEPRAARLCWCCRRFVTIRWASFRCSLAAL